MHINVQSTEKQQAWNTAPFRTHNSKQDNGLLKTELAIEHLRFP